MKSIWKIVVVVILPTLISIACAAQSVERIRIILEKEDVNNDSCCIYLVTIKNVSDSIVCVLHSMFMDLTSSKPQELALYEQTSSLVYFSMHYSKEDVKYDYESTPSRAEAILPYATLRFRLLIPLSPGGKLR